MRAVLLTIADAANRDGEEAHPGLNAIIEGSLYKRSRVLAVVRQLEQEGWIEVVEAPAPGRATNFRVCMDRVQNLDTSPVQPEADPSPDSTGPMGVNNGSTKSPQRVQSATPDTSIEISTTVTTNKPSARKEVTNALLGVCGLDVRQMTGREKQKLGLATNSLVEVGATAAEVSRRSRVFRRVWKGASLTPMALANNWGQLAADQPTAEPKGFDGIREFMEAADG